MGKMAAALVCAAALLCLAACSDDGDSGGGSTPVNAVQVPGYSAGKIVRNKVVSLDGSSELYEYLSFTSGTAGDYALYKAESGVKTRLTTYTDRNGEAKAVPASFTYDPESGKFSAGSVSSYLFNVGSDAVIASEIMGGSGESAYAQWTTGSGLKLTLKEGGTASATDGTNSATGTFTEEDGWITVSIGSKIPLFWSSAKTMYYLAYKTEREEVSEAGRAVGEPAAGIAIASPHLLLIDADL